MSPAQPDSLYWPTIHTLAQRIADIGDRLNDMSTELEGSISEFVLLALSADALGLSARLEAFCTQFQLEEEPSE